MRSEEDDLRERIARLEQRLTDAHRRIGYLLAEVHGPKRALEIISAEGAARRVA